MQSKYSSLMHELDFRKSKVASFLNTEDFTESFRPNHIKGAVLSYILAGGKSLRPAILMLSCSAVNGDENLAIPAAAAVEAYHTWTLVHDDIIDRDATRRGHPTVHTEYSGKAKSELSLSEEEANHYGVSIGILAGDAQLGWAVRMLCELEKKGIAPNVVITLLRDLTGTVLNTLIEGETLDIQYSKRPFDELNEGLITEMLWKKTGILYKFSGMAGAMIGLNTENTDHPYVKTIGEFASQCGIAFQLKDDILGIIGDEKITGKPVGADIREGKKTTIVYFALKNANHQQKDIILNTLGNPRATSSDIASTTNLLQELGGVEKTHKLAKPIVEKAVQSLDTLPVTQSRDILREWANYLIERDF